MLRAGAVVMAAAVMAVVMPTGRLAGFSAARGLQSTAPCPNQVDGAAAARAELHSHTSRQLALNTTGASRRGIAGPVNPGGTTGAGKVNHSSLSSAGTAVAGRASPLAGTAAGVTSTSRSGLYGNGYTYGYGSARSAVPSLRLRLRLPKSLLRTPLRLRPVAGLQPGNRRTAAIGSDAARPDRS